MADVNFLPRFRDAQRHIDRSLDARDPREFALACLEMRDLVTRVRDVIGSATVSDIVAEPRTSGTGS